jgi:hypothetical protein
MASIVYLSASAPPKLASELSLAGVTVWEASNLSEVLYLCDHKQIDVVVIAADVEEPQVVEVQVQRTTIRLTPSATAIDVLGELVHRLPSGNALMQ